VTPEDLTQARLIAAAPALYEALARMTDKFYRALIRTGTDPEYADIAVEDARAALALARGDQ